MKSQVFTFFYDTESGWLKVPMDIVRLLGLTPKHISNKSYKDQLFAYINEDEDVDTFLKTCKACKLKFDLNCSFAKADFIRQLLPFASSNQMQEQ